MLQLDIEGTLADPGAVQRRQAIATRLRELPHRGGRPEGLPIEVTTRRRYEMRYRLLRSIGVVAAVALVSVTMGRVNGQAQTSTPAGQPAATPQPADAPQTPWGEPDLQGIWSVELLVPLERPAGVTTQFYTDEEVAELDGQRAGFSVFGNHLRAEPGSEADVAGAYNEVYTSLRPTSRRTGMIVDPPDGKMPPITPAAQELQAAMREYQQALIQHTVVCRDNLPGCLGGTYGPPSPRRAEPPPYYSTRNVNRADGPEDRSLGERCMSGNLPNFRGGFTGVFRRIVQSPGNVTLFYDAGQGQGFTRNIPITTAPHLPSTIRQWWGDSRGHWEGEILVVDVTNFTPKTDYQGSRENLHLVERWTRTGPDTLEVVSMLEDPTVWTRPWTVIQEFQMQSNEANRIYTEPRCHEGNFGMLGVLAGARAEERAFAEGRGPDPATRCLAGCASSEGRDPLR